MRRCVALIIDFPARYAARRLPGKLLADLGGMPVLQRAYEGAISCPRLDRLVVATDDDRDRAAVRALGADATLTSMAHVSGTDRVAEVDSRTAREVIVNIQGDEPFVNSAVLEEVVGPPIQADGPDMATLCKRVADGGTLEDRIVAKVVTDDARIALCCSRHPIPCPHREAVAAAWEHLGIYVHLRSFLLAFRRVPVGSLEKAEGPEQLRALQRGYRIAVVETRDPVGANVDTPNDLVRARTVLEAESERALSGDRAAQPNRSHSSRPGQHSPEQERRRLLPRV